MSTISKDTYRSAGKGVNYTDDMVRVTITLTQREFKRIEHRLKAALKLSESRPTVRAKHPVQQTQLAIAQLYDQYMFGISVSEGKRKADLRDFVEYVEQQQAMR
jgi:hypothetical protein